MIYLIFCGLLLQSAGAQTSESKLKAYISGNTEKTASTDFIVLKSAGSRGTVLEQFMAQIEVLKNADFMIANLTPAQGPTPQSGVAWEMGYMLALGKPVFGFSHTTEKFADRIRRHFQNQNRNDFSKESSGLQRTMDPNGYAIEEFNLTNNLMLDGAIYHSFGKVRQSVQEVFQKDASQIRIHGKLFRHFDRHPHIGSALKTAYLAGPDVFYENPFDVAEYKKAIAKNYGFEGLAPMDTEVPFRLPVEMFAMDIFYANLNHMLNADHIAANARPWRWAEMDEGTEFEMGFMFGLGKLVWAYRPPNFQHIKNKMILGSVLASKSVFYPDLIHLFNRHRCDDLLN